MPPDPPVPPTPAAATLDSSSIDRLVAAIRDRDGVAAPAPSPATPAPAPTASDTLSVEFERLMNEGKAADALALVRDRAFAPQQAQLLTLARSMGEQNVTALRTQFGDKFTKREKKFREAQKKFGVSPEQLADPAIVEQLWQVTYSSDPSYVEEEVESRMKAAETARQAAASTAVPGFSPIPSDVLGAIPESEREKVEKLLPDGVDVSYIRRQLDAYGVSWTAYLKQLAIERDETDPEEWVGSGKIRRRIFNPLTSRKEYFDRLNAAGGRK